jgi:glycosyltransferase involved in cell wall biosynthesis
VFLGCKSVLTIHDILYESHPEFFPELHRRLLKLLVPLSARKASRIMADSEYTKGEIIKYYNIPEEKIKVVHLGVSDKLSPVIGRDLIDAALQRYGISRKYILFVGRIEPRKNISGLLRALDYIKKKGEKDLCLVIVGNQDTLFKEKELFKNIKKMGLDSDVVFTGGVSEKDLALLYNGAEALVYPSFAEGFGLPVLEAMACGTPVITSNTTSLSEIAGDAALLVDPHSFEEIGEGIEAILSNDTLRKDLSHRGVKRAQGFRWEETAKKTIQVYGEVLLSE